MRKGYNKHRLEIQTRLAEIESELDTINEAEAEKDNMLQMLTPTGRLIQLPVNAIPVVLVIVKDSYIRERGKLTTELAAIKGGGA